MRANDPGWTTTSAASTSNDAGSGKGNSVWPEPSRTSASGVTPERVPSRAATQPAARAVTGGAEVTGCEVDVQMTRARAPATGRRPVTVPVAVGWGESSRRLRTTSVTVIVTPAMPATGQLSVVAPVTVSVVPDSTTPSGPRSRVVCRPGIEARRAWKGVGRWGSRAVRVARGPSESTYALSAGRSTVAPQKCNRWVR